MVLGLLLLKSRSYGLFTLLPRFQAQWFVPHYSKQRSAAHIPAGPKL